MLVLSKKAGFKTIFSSTGRGANGFAYFGGGVKLNYGMFGHPVSRYYDAHTIVHEYIHQLTQYALYALENPNFGLVVDPIVMEGARELKAVYEEAINESLRSKSDIGLKQFTGSDGDYGLKNLHEFAADLSLPEFREKLRKLNLWTRVENAIRKILGIYPPADTATAEQKNAYDLAMSALDKMLNNFDYTAYKRFQSIFHSSTDEKLKNAGNYVLENSSSREYGDNNSVNDNNTKYSSLSLRDLFESLRNKKEFNDEDYERIKEISERISNVSFTPVGTDPKEWIGRSGEVRRIIETISAIKGGDRSFEEKGGGRGDEDRRIDEGAVRLALNGISRINGFYFDANEFENNPKYEKKIGAESEVYIDKEKGEVIKFSFPNLSTYDTETCSEFLQYKSLWNSISNVLGDTNYDIIGIGRKTNGDFAIVLKQKYFDGDYPKSVLGDKWQDAVKDYLSQQGFTTRDGYSYP